MPLRLLIQRAYGVRAFQISGGPAWIDSERYDISARTENAVPETELTGPMLQALLENRFRLKLHRVTKELRVLNLTETPAGAKLKKANAIDCADRESHSSSAPILLPCHEVVLSMSPTGARLRGEQAKTGQLVLTLASILGRPVIDKTKLTQDFDLDFEVSRDGLEGIMSFPTPQIADDAAPSINAALAQQLGLKLLPGKGPVEVLVIEHVEKPTEN
jgi:uncharacterized protein (TIGR03435 family)